jgi:CheY-like chemotaxis protein
MEDQRLAGGAFADTLPALDLILLDIHLPYEDGYHPAQAADTPASARYAYRRADRRHQRG